MSARTFAAIALALAGVAACGSHAPSPRSSGPIPADAPAASDRPAAPAVHIGISLAVTPRDADVRIDDRALGKASALAMPLALEPGLHTLVVSLDGYKPYRAEFSVTDKIETFVFALEAAH